MNATVAFYVVVGVCITALPLYITYALAIATALAVNGALLHWTRQPMPKTV